MKKVLVVCTGNICRSPVGEAVLKSFVNSKRLDDKFFIDSAGTHNYHEGEPADERMIKIATQRGYKVDSISRMIYLSDFEKFDYILVMEEIHKQEIAMMDFSGKTKGKVFNITEFCKKYQIKYVPDPYSGGTQGFQFVIDIMEDAMPNFIDYALNE